MLVCFYYLSYYTTFCRESLSLDVRSLLHIERVMESSILPLVTVMLVIAICILQAVMNTGCGDYKLW